MATRKTAEPKTPAKKTITAEPKLRVKATSPKDLATKKKEPYVAVLSVELDPENVGNGAFELDWNDIFVARLLKAGYQGKDDAAIVDRWFQDICRNVIMENFEQWEANQSGENRIIQRRDLGNGRSEAS
jgi:hypothetical protein